MTEKGSSSAKAGSKSKPKVSSKKAKLEESKPFSKVVSPGTQRQFFQSGNYFDINGNQVQ